MKLRTLEFVASFCGLTSLVNVMKTSCIQCPGSNVYSVLVAMYTESW
jgi:hypothetical protein